MNDELDRLKKENEDLKQKLEWTRILLAFSHEWVCSCGCFCARQFNPECKDEIAIWERKTSKLLEYLKNDRTNY